MGSGEMVMLFTPHQWLALHMGGIATYFPLPLFWGLNSHFCAIQAGFAPKLLEFQHVF